MRRLIPVLVLGLTGLIVTSCVTKSEMQENVAAAKKNAYDSAMRMMEPELQTLRAVKELVKRHPKNPGPVGHTHDIPEKILTADPDSIPPGGTIIFIDKTSHDASNHNAVSEYMYFVNNKSLRIKQLRKLMISENSHQHEKIEVVEFEIPNPTTGQPTGSFVRVAYFK